jgi:hypothetical protein
MGWWEMTDLSPATKWIMKKIEKKAKDEWDKKTDPMLIQAGWKPEVRQFARETFVNGFIQGGAWIYLYLKGTGQLRELEEEAENGTERT